jgi:hypothetical protein
MLQAGMLQVRFPMRSLIFFLNLPILSGRTRPKGFLAFNRNENQKQEEKMFLGSKAWPVLETNNLTAIYELIV